MKLILGLIYSALSVFLKFIELLLVEFFIDCLHILSKKCKHLVFWPCKDIILDTLPVVLKKKLS